MELQLKMPKAEEQPNRLQIATEGLLQTPIAIWQISNLQMTKAPPSVAWVDLRRPANVFSLKTRRRMTLLRTRTW